MMTSVLKARRMVRDEGARVTIAAIRSALGQWWKQGEFWQIHKPPYVRLDNCRIGLERTYSPALLNLLKTGLYELPERTAIHRYLDANLPVIELGASIGVVACATNRRLRRKRSHVVVEANPNLIPYLAANRERNCCDFEILNRALGYGGALLEMRFDGDSLAGSAYSPDGERAQIPTIMLSDILDRSGFERVTLICDIEGSEYDLIENEGPVLAARVGVLIMEVHDRILGPERSRQLWRELERLGFKRTYCQHESHVFQNEASRG